MRDKRFELNFVDRVALVSCVFFTIVSASTLATIAAFGWPVRAFIIVWVAFVMRAAYRLAVEWGARDGGW